MRKEQKSDYMARVAKLRLDSNILKVWLTKGLLFLELWFLVFVKILGKKIGMLLQ